MTKFSKVCLVIVISLLAVIAMRPIFSPQPTLAASHRYEYLVVTPQTWATSESIQSALDKHAAEGWELVTAGFYETGVSPGPAICTLIFRRETR